MLSFIENSHNGSQPLLGHGYLWKSDETTNIFIKIYI